MAREPIVTADAAEFRFDDGNDNINILCRDGALFDFEIKEPWAGSSETGFGQTCDISMDASAAKALADWIYARLGLAPLGAAS